jgi:hypothetical protein
MFATDKHITQQTTPFSRNKFIELHNQKHIDSSAYAAIYLQESATVYYSSVLLILQRLLFFSGIFKKALLDVF